MLRITTIIIAVLLIAFAAFGYYRYTVGIIEPHDIYPEALGQTRVSVERYLGRPRRLDDIGNGLANAFWQGKEPYSWVFSVWYLNDVAVHIKMPNDLVALDLQDVKDRLGPAIDWQIGAVTYSSQSYPAWTNGERSIVVYETPLDYQVANKNSIFWD